MPYREQFDGDEADEVKCDHCGKPTPRLYPRQVREICDECFYRERLEREQRRRPAKDSV